MSIRLIIVDDHIVVREGLREVVSGSGIEVTAEASNVTEAVDALSSNQFDVILLDVRIPGGDGFSILRQLRQKAPKTGVLFFSAHDHPGYIARAISIGASGYLLKDQPANVLIEAIRKVAAGNSVWTREEFRRVTGALATPRLETDVEVPLTQRESDVLMKMVLGQTNKQIAVALDISYETVKEHVQHILKKIGVSDRTQASVWAFRKGIA